MSAEQFTEAGWATEAFAKPSQGKLAVMFHEVQKKIMHESELRGVPVFKSVVHILKIPADQFLRIDRPVTRLDKEEFPVEWARWEQTRETKVLGFPIDHWPQLTETQKAEFKAAQITTVEQIANAPDIFGQRYMGFADLREKAKIFLQAGRDSEMIGKIRAEADQRVSAMEAEMKNMRETLARLTSGEPVKRGPGRPPKQEAT